MAIEFTATDRSDGMLDGIAAEYCERSWKMVEDRRALASDPNSSRKLIRSDTLDHILAITMIYIS